MKTQMRFQKILMIVTLVLAAAVILHALMFCSGIFDQITRLREYDSDLYNDAHRANGVMNLFNASQGFSDTFLILGIIFIVLVAVMFLMGCQNRRKYYITNYIAIGLVVAYELILIVLLFVNLAQIQVAIDSLNVENVIYWYGSQSETGNLEALNNPRGPWPGSTWTMVFGYVLCGLIFADAVVLVLNLVWKLKLMKGEKALIEQGFQKEVA